MIRLLFTALLCVLASSQATAQNWLSQALLELDDWEVLCRDRNSYSLTITPEQTAHIELVSCRELLATSKMLSHRAGSRSKAKGCRIK
jgi:hypothetical protein